MNSTMSVVDAYSLTGDAYSAYDLSANTPLLVAIGCIVALIAVYMMAPKILERIFHGYAIVALMAASIGALYALVKLGEGAVYVGHGMLTWIGETIIKWHIELGISLVCAYTLGVIYEKVHQLCHKPEDTKLWMR